ncbi:MAG: insulinase family protein [Planctomycetota bacterium]|nr:insulinase family protein [Planctomycetota bacterium]
MKAIPALLFSFLIFSSPAFAQDVPGMGQPRAWEHETSDVPVDSRIHFGHFDNGVRWAWVNHAEPKDRCYIRLHVNVGSLAETDSEAGMAHFLEHMAFNGSENFAAGTLIEWFQEHGMSFGADTNAHTAFSETVYKLDLPESDEATLKSGLQVLRDFGGGLLLEEKEVQAEKGVIDGEQRERDSALFRVLIQELEQSYAGTLYPRRLPIGTKEVRDVFTADSIRRFYQKWYRPENMTVVLVGDLKDLDPVPLIQAAFGTMSVPPMPLAKEPEIGTPVMKDLFYTIYEKEIAAVNISVKMVKPYEEEAYTKKKMVEDLALNAAHAMLNTRYREILKQEDVPFLAASVGDAGGLKVFEGGALSVSSEPGKWKEALSSAEDELRRALKFGFQQAELEEVRANQLRSLQESVERESTQHSKSILGELVAACEERIVPTHAVTNQMILAPAMGTLTVEACNQALRNHWKGGTLSMTLFGNLDLGTDGGEQLKAVHDAGKTRRLDPPKTIEMMNFSYASLKENAAKVLHRKYIEDLKIYTAQFSNGVRVNVKKTDFKEKQILMNVRVGEGQLTVDPKKDGAVAWVSDKVFSAGGLVKHSNDDLRRLLAGKEVGILFGMREDAFVLSGATVPEDLLLEFELACAWMQFPGYRKDGLNQLMPQLPMLFQQFAHQPRGPLLLEFLPEVFSHDTRFSPLPPMEQIAGVTMDAVRNFLSHALATGPVELTVVGDVDVDAVFAAAAQTFGVLPQRRERQEVEGRRQPTAPKGGVRMTRSVETQIPQSLVTLVFPTSDGIAIDRRRNLSFLGNIVNDRLRLEVRERLGAAYSPGAQSDANAIYEGMGSVVIQAMADPDKVQILVDACKSVARDLYENGVTQEEVSRLVEPLLAGLRDAMRTNGWWLNILSDAQTHPDTLSNVRSVEAFFQNMSASDLSSYTKRYMNPANASILVVNPELPEPLELVAPTPSPPIEEE